MARINDTLKSKNTRIIFIVDAFDELLICVKSVGLVIKNKVPNDAYVDSLVFHTS